MPISPTIASIIVDGSNVDKAALRTYLQAVEANNIFPVVVGGGASNSSLELRSTLAVGTTDFVKITVGTNGSVESARAHASGAFLVGGVTSRISNETLQVFKNANQDSLWCENQSASNTARQLVLNNPFMTGGTGYKLIEGDDTTGVVINVYGNGNITNKNNSYGAISDAKLKEDIVPSGSQWDDVKALGAATSKFVLKSDPENKVQLGLSAQDVLVISPGLVFSVPDYEDYDDDRIIPSGIVDESGKQIPDSFVTEKIRKQRVVGETLGVNYSVLYMKAVKALGEALVRIEGLEYQVAQLLAK